jgi:hydrogenase nickel incorporation protein HypA/HybF
MHESGVIEDLMKAVEDAARKNGAQKVTSIKLRIGSLAGIEPDHLREHFVIAAVGTMAEGAALDIETTEEPGGIVLQSLEIET